jgi:hypothetical protein
MTTTPMAHHVCQRCGRSGTREFVNVGNGRWECTDSIACRRRSIQVTRREKATRAPLTELPTLLGDGTVETVGDKAWFEIDTAGYREAIMVEYHPNEEQPFRVWVRSWGPDYALTGESESGAFDTSAEAAIQVSAILAAIARSQKELGQLPMSCNHRSGDTAAAHAKEWHTHLSRESCPKCEGRELPGYPRAADIETPKKSWPTV